MRNIISYFIKFPVAGWIVVWAFVLFGYFGYNAMTSSFFPLADSRIITISLTYPGASPQEMEEGVVLKIEDNLKGILGIERVTSTSNENSAVITIETFKDYDIDVALADVKNAVDKVPSFPSGMEPAVIEKVEAVRETITFTLSGEHVPLTVLKQKAQAVEKELLRMDGVSQVSINGYPDEEIEVAVTEAKLRAYGLSFNDVASAVSKNSLLTTGGSIKTSAEEYLIRANTRAYYASGLENIVVKSDADGNVVLLKDLAVLRDRFNETPNALFFNGNASVQISVSNTNSEDLITTAEKINAYIEDYNANATDVHIDVTSDSSITLNQRTQLLITNAWQGILLVLIVLSLFLKPRIAMWVAFGLPIAFFGMFAVAGQFDVTINVLSLFAMIIVIGILVDDGIVIAENIYSHYENGKSPIKAAIDGTLEVIPPIVSAILTTILAFSTFLFLDGRIGEFFSEVSVVVLITLLVSLVEALIILPSHIAHSKTLQVKTKPYKFNVAAEKLMLFLRDKFYSPILHFFMNYKILGFAIMLGLLIITFGGIKGGIIRTTFFPKIASDRIQISLNMPEGTHERITDSIISNIEKTVWEVNKSYKQKQTGNKDVVLNVIKRLGPGTAVGTLNVNLLQGEFRDFTADEITNAIQKSADEVIGAESLVFGSGASFGGSPIAVSLLGNKIDELKAAKEELKEGLSKISGIKDIKDNDPQGIKEIKINLKPNGYLLGFTLNDVMSQVRAAFFGAEAQRFQRGEDEIKVWIRYDESERKSINNLDNMQLVSNTGTRVPFSEIATYVIERGEISINHLDGQREIQVTADLTDPKASATDFMDNIKTTLMTPILEKYPSVTPLYEGQNREAVKTQRSLNPTGWIIIVLIYVVIAFTFRSYSQPFVLMALVPFSIIGVGWGHWFHGFPINILSGLGIIALIGIMVNDGLVLISKFNINLKEGMSYNESLLEACKSRFRAIFLTTITTVAGLTPLLFEKSRQAQFLKPMAISIVYGISIATVLTLLLLPVFMSFINSIKVNSLWFWNSEKWAFWQTEKPSRRSLERAVTEENHTHED
ncbi:efflux RND transporter permease subunit [Ochrovirga pacifica]|uniref:efflux RND transporter permease subunit n=1 Tax=Ochrovirga pacifica TaxID=1042376 RepID=UPI0002559AAF|nr:efflux RND transporter permease subunit [Ochrovirga pacifica]